MQYCVHHLNDFSGSPLILRERLNTIAAAGPPVLITNFGSGFLSDWNGPVVRIGYTKHDNAVLRFFSLSLWYLRAALYLLRSIGPGDRLILSTLISSPLLMVLLAKRQVKAQVFVNEVLFRVPVWRAIGLRLMNRADVEKIYLSRFVQDSWRFSGPARIVYPKLRQAFIDMDPDTSSEQPVNPHALRFVLVCSQTDAKGYRLFIDIARHFEAADSAHTFALYLSGSSARFAKQYPVHAIPASLTVVFNETSPEIFLGHDVFLGLTNPAEWVETFGQTFAEAMLAGNITVVPPVGAQLEYVQDGSNGFVFTDYSLDGILHQIERIRQHPAIGELKRISRQSMLDFISDQEPYRPLSSCSQPI